MSASGMHGGTGSWLLQRASAIVLALLLPGLLGYFLFALPVDFSSWRALFAPLWLRVSMLLAGLALALHSWIGMRDIFMDYVRPLGLRLALDLAVIVTLAATLVWLAAVVWGVA
jgi:succinate dehydrogenase / fumarate reductase membrane anchor subunit